MSVLSFYPFPIIQGRKYLFYLLILSKDLCWFTSSKILALTFKMLLKPKSKLFSCSLASKVFLRQLLMGQDQDWTSLHTSMGKVWFEARSDNGCGRLSFCYWIFQYNFLRKQGLCSHNHSLFFSFYVSFFSSLFF